MTLANSGTLNARSLTASGPDGAAALAAGGMASDYARPRNESDAARQFEALFIGQMLRTAHETDADGALGSGEDSTGATMWDVAAQQFAQVLADSGGLGLARLITQGLHDREARTSSPDQDPQPVPGQDPPGQAPQDR